MEQKKFDFMNEKSIKIKSKKSEWTTGDSKKCDDCSWIEKNKTDVIVYLPLEVQQVISKLCKEIKLEWQMLLSGSFDNNVVTIEGYYIPKQVVTGATVKNGECITKEFIEQNKIIATIHSHSNMGTFFSSTDEEYTNLSNIKYHMVCNNKGDIEAVGQFILPCGLVKLEEINLLLEKTQAQEIEVIGIEKIEVNDYTQRDWSYTNIIDKDKEKSDRVKDWKINDLDIDDFQFIGGRLYVQKGTVAFPADDKEIAQYEELVDELKDLNDDTIYNDYYSENRALTIDEKIKGESKK